MHEYLSLEVLFRKMIAFVGLPVPLYYKEGGPGPQRLTIHPAFLWNLKPPTHPKRPSLNAPPSAFNHQIPCALLLVLSPWFITEAELHISLQLGRDCTR